MYSFPAYGQGETRRASGAGSTDVDGDGKADRARFDYSQVLVAYDDSPDLQQLGRGIVHFRNVYTCSLRYGQW